MAEIWERQKGERDTSYIYFHIFLYELKQRPKKLQDVINYIENLPSEGNLKQYQSNLIKVPTLTQLQHMSSKWNWQDRETAFTNHLNQLDLERDEERYNKTNELVKEGLEKDLKDIDEYSKELHESDYSLTTKVNLKYTLARAKDLTIKNLRLSHGRSISISESNDKVKVDGNIEYGGFDKLVKALDETRKQYKKQNRQ
ncbi:MAG: hypothetical protein J6T31_00400 [Methanobrevibacter sp.]|nr:hypothetical protein [Methanobrevibacter sp.]